MASAFLGKYAFITVVDLIQRKKLNFWNFYEFNLTETRFEINSLPFYLNNYGIYVSELSKHHACHISNSAAPDQIICARPAASSKRRMWSLSRPQSAQKNLAQGQATNPMNMAVSKMHK